MTALSVALSVPAYAQQTGSTGASEAAPQTDDFHGSEEIVVTAPYVERLDILSGTSAVTGDLLAEKTRAQLGDILSSLPGVSATSFSPGASRPVLRGYQGNRVAVLTDGIGNIDASNTSADHAVTIDTLTVERIEVLRGPAVLLFGGQAVGGAVNALDKRIPRSIPDEAVHVDALAGYGSAARDWSGGASVDVPLTDRVVVHADGSYRNSDDLRTGGNILSPSLRAEVLDFAAEEASEGNLDEAAEARALADQRGRIPNSAVKSWTAAGGIAFIDDGGNMGLSYSIYDTNYGIPARPGTAHAHDGGAEEVPVTIGMRQYRFDFRGELDLGDGLFEKLRLRAGYANYSHTEFEGDEIGTIFNSKGIEARAELIQNDRGGWRGASGVQYQSRKLDAIGAEAFVPPNKSRQFGLFTLQEFTVGNLDAEVALRFDTAELRADTLGISRSFNNVSSAFGVGYHIGDLKIGANLSRTGRAPAVEELFSNGPHIATQAFEVGNPLLKSERAWNGELYGRYDTPDTAFNLTLYTNRFDNFIYEAETGAIEADLPVFQYFQNDAKVWGVEFQGSQNVARFGDVDLKVDAVADYTRAKISAGAGNIPRIPPLRVLGGVEMNSARLDLRGEVEWSDAQTKTAPFETATDGFTLVNATATWRPFGSDRNIALIASANNIFDVVARRSASFTKDFVPLSGRDFRLSARISF
ncbi:iron complex outermembrane receptor protein [Sphingorhabdus rigui]|uniref:Iron complex outermembrane receptor protein n=1 Tax=Sphingorhabdus rigui TaxID=1282858 RepID=A0A840B4J5_9SPHN|nr:TonB-dependent receptor [Sphingorhabdus rigui]MBB3943125.1 iron complex outermembrane receptor protein [Sphingorhabdus rigui]